jgi:putative acetyltransferase
MTGEGRERRLNIREITPADDTVLAEIIRDNLRKKHLDIPGTVYYDENLYHLSDFYLADKGGRYYFIATDDRDKVIGGIGLAEVEFLDDCAELQKLYLTDEAKGNGFSYKLISLVEDKAREFGYKRIYLETHDNLQEAIHVYQKSGYREIEKPQSVVHSTMNRFFIKEL